MEKDVLSIMEPNRTCEPKMSFSLPELAVIALGGKLLADGGTYPTVEEEYQAVCTMAGQIADLVEQGYKIIITHGNVPQIGLMFTHSEIANDVAKMHRVPLVNCGADTQGSIGYQFQQALQNEFKRRGVNRTAVTVVTQVMVAANDPEFRAPTKPIGSNYTKEQAEQMQRENPGWKMICEPGRGYRRVVPSPMPQAIIEKEVISRLVRDEYCVIGAGGGGIPVVKLADGLFAGVDAVIDQDLSSALLAAEVKADILIVATGNFFVYLDYGTPKQKPLTKVTLTQLKHYASENQFAAGRMKSKILAAIDFLEKGGKRVIITNPEALVDAVAERTGTHIIP